MISDTMPMSEYLAHPAIGSSAARKARKSLSLYKAYRDGTLPESSARYLDFGTAFELALCAPAMFISHVRCDAEVVESIGGAKPRSTNIYKEWVKDLGEDILIIPENGPESLQTINAMLATCKADPIIMRLIEGTQWNWTFLWTDPDTGLELKTRPDICTTRKPVIVSIKTALDGSPEAFTRDMVKYSYPMQAAFEMEGVVRSGRMERVDGYYWLVCEKQPPYNATLYELDPDDMAGIMADYHYTIGLIAEAERSGRFPGYTQRADNPHGILTAKIPPYYFTS